MVKYVGLSRMKTMLRSVMAAAEDSARYPDEGGSRPPNMTFLGPPGTGKTEMARLAGTVLHDMGVLGSGEFVEVTKQTLLGQYSNRVGDAVRACVDRARGGVLFIDEVYALTRGEDAIGQEAIDALTPLMSQRDDVLFIIAGYYDPTMEFLASNEGLDRRFPAHGRVEFQNYDADELYRIVEQWQPKGSAVRFELAGDDARVALRRLTQSHFTEPNPTNAGGIIKSMEGVHQAFKERRTRVVREQGRAAGDVLARAYTAADIEAVIDARAATAPMCEIAVPIVSSDS